MVNCFAALLQAFRTPKRRGAIVPQSGAAAKTQYGLSGEAPVLVDDPPPSYPLSKLDGVLNADVLKTIDDAISDLDPSLRELNLDIHDHPEIMWEEKHAHDVLTKYMESRGWAVTRHYLGFDTAWRAEWSHGTGGNVVGVNSEMDALPGIGHACGHNLIAIAGVAVAIAIKTSMEKHNISGKVILLGTPGGAAPSCLTSSAAEEGGAGKVELLKRGAYREMDVCVMCHPGPGHPKAAAVSTTLAIQDVQVEYHGHTAHAGAQPWEGRNALDAAVLAYNAVSVLRQQIKPTHRIHGIIEGRDWAPNIIPDYAKMRWLVRAPTSDEAQALSERLVNCIKAAALATACEPDIKVGHLLKDLRNNLTLGTSWGNITYGKLSQHLVLSSVSNLASSALPALHPGYSIPAEPNGGNHTAAFAEAARTEEAHARTLVISKALAMTGVRVLTDNEFLKEVRCSDERLGRTIHIHPQVKREFIAQAAH
ncbi:hypothetical protein AURDEDRAFT_69157 [Auricularia subglabra TFB-10046 SS5]|nr:hypothetical protein AURDEDRAFT_69157 [Auricularia subglabra TFB-10046 SS5]